MSCDKDEHAVFRGVLCVTLSCAFQSGPAFAPGTTGAKRTVGAPTPTPNIKICNKKMQSFEILWQQRIYWTTGGYIARMWTEAMFVLDLVGRYAAHDVICEEQNFLEDEITLLEPRAVPNRPRPRTPCPSNHPPTSPPKSFSGTGFSAPRHISTTTVTLNLAGKQSDVLQEF
jgi:hypothetical protein